MLKPQVKFPSPASSASLHPCHDTDSFRIVPFCILRNCLVKFCECISQSASRNDDELEPLSKGGNNTEVSNHILQFLIKVFRARKCFENLWP